MSPVSEKTPGQVGYEAYKESSAGRSLVTGDELPNWEGLRDVIQEAWEASASAVLGEPEGAKFGEEG